MNVIILWFEWVGGGGGEIEIVHINWVSLLIGLIFEKK